MRDAPAGQLIARPGPTRVGTDAPAGLLPLNEETGRSALLYVPPTGGPAPLVLMLHGAGGIPRHSVDLLRPLADEFGLIVAAPASRLSTWDMIAERRFGADVAAIDLLLERIFEDHAIDPDRTAIAGFSDGASYALSLGLMNGDLFRHILAFSPGFLAPLRQKGSPSIFISHGDEDQVLPVERCSRRIVRQLEDDYAVEYVEFAGGHIAPAEVARQAIERLVQP